MIPVIISPDVAANRVFWTPASKEDLEQLNQLNLAFFGQETYGKNTFVLVTYYADEANRPDFGGNARNIVLALNLFKPLGVFLGPIFEFQDEKSLKMEELAPRVTRFGPPQGALGFDEIPALRSLVKKIQSLDFDQRKSLKLACERFQRGIYDQEFDDRLIDFIIAFEALYLKGEKEVRSKGRTIAIACSTFLGKNERERERIKKLMLNAYKIRNSIVHGSYNDTAEQNMLFVDLMPKIENLLRESIKRFLD